MPPQSVVLKDAGFMDAYDPILVVLLFSVLAAGAAALGSLPTILPGGMHFSWIGSSLAIASGLMLGAGYVLMAEVIKEGSPLPPVLGAALGVAYTFWTHRFSGSEEIETLPESRIGEAQELRLLLLGSLHSASEGIAIGGAMAINLWLGIFMALSLAVHNIAEAMALTWVLRLRNVSAAHAAVLGVITNVPQILMAIVSYSIVSAEPLLLSWLVGFAAGALLYLVLTELLPASYRNGNNTKIALLVSFSAGGLVLLEGFWR
ncbi:MAG: ZIP family metal transporter [Nitrospinaceae bacterium]|nr:ZIP family metal transporter [Nitrospinaceae bacterium]MBT5947533.1 ZIP family metal transporter [Nitrospinaceae bacterium]MBT6395643.1 ZIP family metal transporter [Nitrospinaceae bacterium]